MLTEAVIVLGLLLANGLFALAEIAVVSSRKGHLRKLARQGSVRAAIALALAEAPARFLSTIQLGITLIGVVAGAFGGTTIAKKLAPILEPTFGEYAYSLAVGLVVVVIAVLQLIFGELVPKRLAMAHPERLALVIARPMNWLSRIGGPLVSLLAWATEGVLKLFGVGRAKGATVSDEEVSLLIEQGLSEGVFHEAEKRMVEGVLQLDHLTVPAIMTPRPKIVWLDLDDPDEVNWRKIVASGHSYFPVHRGGPDNIVGMLSVKALWANSAAGFQTPMRDLLTKPLFVPETVTGIQVLETFKRTGRHIALVTDEFGTVSGIVTLIDVLEAIVGDLPSRGKPAGPEAHQRADGSWLVDATMAIVDVRDVLGVSRLPGEERADFQTLGGFIMTHFGRIPKAGDFFEAGGFRWEVVDMDRFR
ncbi:MAG: HlyC/CorC family transporter, partial [Opitutaceae bacterium]|nr:HlyC/CorC family transporter [Opitutaceae bacterium]